MDAGANVNHCNAAGDTALHAATRTADLTAVQALLARGASAVVENLKEETPVDVARALHASAGDPTAGLGASATTAGGGAIAEAGEASGGDGDAPPTWKERLVDTLQCMDAAIDGAKCVA